jgi:hypothetical protein
MCAAPARVQRSCAFHSDGNDIKMVPLTGILPIRRESGKEQNGLMEKPRVYRFNTLKTAESFRLGSGVGYATLLGDDMLYWVPESNRETGRLVRAGYEVAE